ncbi:isochorismatase family protein [Novosphingobium sp. KN65.2]|uniref:isochorismatase family protein n=1 Tax=Novosphingobium sp. KN65.2 TaxID=1478134 RepID=UPI0005E0D102|nr:isochorismatase family protein [Novosphingobium sp. KN65.2]CDO38043.1 Isochorismatase hydrolase [Novosphingobium sp. KN65.2]
MAAEKSDLDNDYAGAGFGGGLEPGKRPALLLVDMVRAYLDPESPLYARGEAALAQAVRLAEAARKAGVPVILTNVEYVDGKEGGMFFRKVPGLRNFMAGSPLGAFPEELTPKPGDRVLTKFYPSAFFGTALAPMLVAEGIDTLLIGGYSTSGCVRASALDALCHGFVPLVVADACADRDPRPHDGNLFDIRAKIGEVIDAEAALDVIRATSA